MGKTANHIASHTKNTAGGKLIICPTPIGNLGDVSKRVLCALSSCDVVCAEDTRITGKLLAAFHIEKRLERLDEALMDKRVAALIERVAQGQVVAYCSDAGTPGVSDPGLRLVHAARKANVAVEVLPGPTAAATAYVASGTLNPRFYFGGFFPRKQTERVALLQSLRTLDAALIFYESPKRLLSALHTIANAYPHRVAAVCRELTKLHEEVVRAPLPRLYELFAAREQQGGIKGEIVLVIEGPSADDAADARCDAILLAKERAAELKACGMHSKDIACTLTDEFGIARNAAYDIALGL